MECLSERSRCGGLDTQHHAHSLSLAPAEIFIHDSWFLLLLRRPAYGVLSNSVIVRKGHAKLQTLNKLRTCWCHSTCEYLAKSVTKLPIVSMSMRCPYLDSNAEKIN